jgi:hypothetical protein
MGHFRRSVVLGFTAVICVSTVLRAAQDQAPRGEAAAAVAVASPVVLSDLEMETFLTTATIVRTRGLSVGVTDSRRATLTDGRITHDAHIQDVDESAMVYQAGKATEFNFKDTYRYNIAGYRLARLVGLDNVPMSVERRVEGKTAAVTWWIDDRLMDEKERMAIKPRPSGPDPERTAKQTHIMRVWDELIQNRDRNQGNIIWTKDWKLWLIDHTRAFRLGKELLKPIELTRCERTLLEKLRGLTMAGVAEAAGRSLTRDEAAAVAARAALIVKHFEDRIAKLGEGAVLFSM